MSQVRAFLAVDLDDDLKPKINKIIKKFKQIDTKRCGIDKPSFNLKILWRY